MNPFSLNGSFVALITPFDKKGRIDVAALEALVEWHIQEGSAGLVCAGSTGEARSLNELERRKILQICIKTAKKRIPIIAGTGMPDTRQTLRLTRQALQENADACLVVTPYYSRPTQKGCILHFQEVSKIGLPFIVYNNPTRSTIQLSPETISEIGQLPCALALKESTNDPLFVRKIRLLSSLPILAGEDALTYEMLQEGAQGGISVIANLIPNPWSILFEHANAKKWVEAKAISDLYLPVYDVLFSEPNPQCVKYILFLMGKCSPTLRLPLIEPNSKTQLSLKTILPTLYLYRNEFKQRYPKT
jgi:4-hydroxy-tetrahydrodipicolinate synthase